MAYLTQVRWDDKEGDLGMTHGGIQVLLPCPILVAEPVKVVILDLSGVTFADAAGAKEVAQVRE
jgi:solute carrier family 26 protein 10